MLHKIAIALAAASLLGAAAIPTDALAFGRGGGGGFHGGGFGGGFHAGGFGGFRGGRVGGGFRGHGFGPGIGLGLHMTTSGVAVILTPTTDLAAPAGWSVSVRITDAGQHGKGSATALFRLVRVEAAVGRARVHAGGFRYTTPSACRLREAA